MDEKDELSSDHESEVTAPDSTDDSNDSLLTVSFNQDGGCLAVGTARGFRICNVSPYQETFRRNFSAGDGGGIGSVEMLFRCNLLALVGGGASPQYPPNKVLIWDDHLGRPIGELSFRQRVLTVRLRRDRICVALRDRVYVYNFGNLALLDTIITGAEKNGLGLLSISTDAGGKSGALAGESDDDGMVLACPSVQRGQVRIELYGMRKNLLIDAHESPLAAIGLSVDGSLLATASERGTIIRLFETGKKVKGHFGSNASVSSHPPGTPIREFRRGVEHAVIGCLSFSMDKMWLACASDHETVHIFRIYDEDGSNSQSGNSSRYTKSPAKSKSSLSYASMYAKKILPNMLTKSPKTYLQGEQSFAQVRGGITRPQICTFVPDKPYTIAVVGLDNYGNGCLMLSSFGSNHDNCKDVNNTKETSFAVKGQTKRLSFHRFFKKGMDKKNRAKRTCNNEVFTGDCQVVCSDDAEIETPMYETDPEVPSSNARNEEHDFVNVATLPDQTSTPAAIYESEEPKGNIPRALECDEKCLE
jgi:WD domain, G-beta repeat.